MNANLPIQISEVNSLTNFGFSPELFKPSLMHFESDKYISAKVPGTDGNNSLLICELESDFNTYKKNISRSEMAMMHPSKNIIALRAGDAKNSVIQVHDMSINKRVKNLNVNQQVVYWKWLSDDSLGIVTAQSVYAIDITDPNSPAKKLFDRKGQLQGQVSIVNLSADPNGAWFVLAAITRGASGFQGFLQVFNKTMNSNNVLEGFGGVFGEVKVLDAVNETKLMAFIEKKANDKRHTLIMTDYDSKQFKGVAQLQLDNPNDFPYIIKFIKKYGVVVVITQMGGLHVIEISKGIQIYKTQLSEEPCILATNSDRYEGILCITQRGRILSINIDANNLLPFMLNELKQIANINETAFSMASRFNLPGADAMFTTIFRNHISNGNWVEAAKIARDSPNESLRTPETINIFRSGAGNPPPIQVYFQTILEKKKMNHNETIEISKNLISGNKLGTIAQWLQEGKITPSEQLSEMIKPYDNQLSLKLLLASGSPSAHGKVIETLVQTRQFNKIFSYCQQNNYKPDYAVLLRNIIPQDPDAALELAKFICNRQSSTFLIDVNTLIEVFYEQRAIKQVTSFMLEYLKDNRPEDSFLQTRILEINLVEVPQAGAMLMSKNLFSHYDRKKIANLCEQTGMMQHALENYTDIEDIKRVLKSTHMIDPNYLVTFLGRLPQEHILSCLTDLLRSNPNQNMNVVIEAAVKYHDKVPVNEIVKLFDSQGFQAGLFYFLSRIVHQINDTDIMMKYITAGCIAQKFEEVERVIKEYDNYDAEKVKEYLIEKKVQNPRPLILLCHKHNYIGDLTRYLVKTKQLKFLESYLFQAQPENTPEVCGTLLDEDYDENYIRQILNTVRGNCPIDKLVEEFHSRHRIKLLQQYLEDRKDEGNQTPALHNALAFIYIDSNSPNPKDFLSNNAYYDAKVVGAYCEDRDPHLAVIAYRRASPDCDAELIELTNKNAMYRLQAEYLVESQNEALWGSVLNEDNEHKKSVIDQVISVILPMTRDADQVSCAVKAFIEAGLEAELMELLEKLVLHNAEFMRNDSLQNLLIMTAISADPNRVKGYLSKLESYDGPDIAAKCLEAELYEEAFFIYDKKKSYTEAVHIVITYISDIKRATIYAEKINTPEVWSKVGRAQVKTGEVEDALEALIKATDWECFSEVITAASQQNKWDELISYLTMVREYTKDKAVDSELIYAYAKTDKITELETFLVGTHVADLTSVAERVFSQRLWEAAKILYENTSNKSKLASCYVHLGQHSSALQAAKAANNPKCWKEICFACIQAEEFRIAAQAGSNILIHPDHVESLVKEYEKWGAYGELINLFESNLGSDRNHIITELGILYAKYAPAKLLDHCRNNYEKMNVPKLIRVCEQWYHWAEVVFLHSHYNGYDEALKVMMEHSPTAFKHELFTQILQKVGNSNLYLDAIRFYIAEQPQHLNDMLKFIANKIDLSLAVTELRRNDALPFAVPFLKSVQSVNNYDVNEALNEIYVEEEDYEALKASILEYSSFDQLSLAKIIESHELLEFRRISGLVYRKNKKYSQSIEISKKLKFFKDAIDTAFESGNGQLCEDLLRYFAEEENKECFSATLYTCYEFVKPDVALELAWRYNFIEFLMPFMIQTVKDLTSRIDYMQKRAEDKEKKEKQDKEGEAIQPLDYVNVIPNNAVATYTPPVGGLGQPGGNPGFGQPGLGNNPGFGGPGLGQPGGNNFGGHSNPGFNQGGYGM